MKLTLLQKRHSGVAELKYKMVYRKSQLIFLYELHNVEGLQNELQAQD